MSITSCSTNNIAKETFSGIHEETDPQLEKFLMANGYTKVTYYFDNKNKIDGEWKLYPRIQISEHLYIISVSNIAKSDKYGYAIFLDTNKWQVFDQMGPFYDSYPESAEIKTVSNGYTVTLTIRNPPDDDERTYRQTRFINKPN